MATTGRPRQRGSCAKHRARQAKYVAKNPGKQRARVKKHYAAHASEIKAAKKRERKAHPGKAKRGSSKSPGRPRTC